ncbi:MAG: hypothetical protein PF517_14885 [Salinivirgaceae bacterium]|jgi:peptidoglycan hydrolase CwlO-like protein|nr:hypothetical protein [Salinivirgaceae bacterium]
MNILSILFVQSFTGSVIIIVLLLAVTAVIGFFTAWFYSKSIYTPIVKNLEDENVVLNTEISGLKNDAVNLNSTIDKLNDKISNLEKDIAKKEN